jgi:hypothetical protein
VTETLEHTARRIAERGRDALVARLRPAFAEAASAHADVLQLDDDQLEQMVQRAADRADGLQWRRALAGVATEQLGISLGEALSHPAVARAQAIVGAPSYEAGLAALAAHRPPEGERERELAGPAGAEAQAHEAAADTDEPHAPAAAYEPHAPVRDPVRLAAVHLGGIANLAPAHAHIELRLSEHGLDIVGAADEILGRLGWEDVRALDVPPARGGLRRRRREPNAHLVIRTDHGHASFEVPALSPDELREHLDPWSSTAIG